MHLNLPVKFCFLKININKCLLGPRWQQIQLAPALLFGKERFGKPSTKFGSKSKGGLGLTAEGFIIINCCENKGAVLPCA